MVDRDTVLIGGAVALGAYLLSRAGMAEEPMGTTGQTTTTTTENIPDDPVGSLVDGVQSFANDVTSSPQVEAVGDIGSAVDDATQDLGIDDDLPGGDTVTDTAAAVAGAGNLNAGVEAVTTVTDAVTDNQTTATATQTDAEAQEEVTQEWTDEGIVSDSTGGTTTGTQDPNVDTSGSITLSDDAQDSNLSESDKDAFRNLSL